MASSETQQKTISLGKLLVESLAKGSDILSRWMANYIAELIIASETAEPDQQRENQARCFSAILALWQRRDVLPGECRPFKEYDAILATIGRLDPTTPRFLYGLFHEPIQAVANDPSKPILDAVEAVDQTARSLISELLRMAVEQCGSETTRNFLENWPDGDNPPSELSVMLRLSMLDFSEGGEESPEEKAIAEITNRIECLDRFAGIARAIRPQLVKKVAELKGRSTLPAKVPAKRLTRKKVDP